MIRLLSLLAATLALIVVDVRAEEPAYPVVQSEEASTIGAGQLDAYITAWLNCYECTAGELRRLVRIGSPAKLRLQAVMDGNPTFLVDRTTEFQNQWTALKAYAVQTGGEFTISQTDFVTQQQSLIEILYKARAQMAINMIP